MKIAFKIFFCFITFVLLALLQNSSYAQTQDTSSFGVSPGLFQNNILLRGSNIRQEFILSRANPLVNATVTIEPDAPEFQDWLTFSNGYEVFMPKGEQRVPITISLKVPDNAELTKYNGAIRFKLKEENTTGQVIVIPTVRIDLIFNVTNQEQLGFVIKSANIEDFFTDKSMLLNLKIENIGNVDTGPEKVELDISTINNKSVKTLTSNEIPNVESFSIETIEIEFKNHGLDAGQYFANVKVFDKKEAKYEEKVVFTVMEMESIPQTGSENQEKDNNWLSNVLIIAGICLLTGSSLYLFFALKKDRNDKYKRSHSGRYDKT